MSWTNISKVLSNVKNQSRIKNRFQIEVFKKILQKEINLSSAELSGEVKDIRKLSFQKGKLTIGVESSLLMQEIFLKKENIKREINKYLKKETIKEIVVRKA